MTLRTIEVDRITLTLDGLPLAQAELVTAQLQAALAERRWPEQAPQVPLVPAGDTLLTSLTGQALVQAIAARLVDLAAPAPALPPEATHPEDTPWP